MGDERSTTGADSSKMLSGGESSVPRVPAHVDVLRRALLACVVLVLAPTVVAVWAARTIDDKDRLPEWVTDQQALMDAIEHDNALIEQDLLKPRARGEFGPFLLVGPEDVNETVSRERCDVRNSYGVGVEWESLGLAEVLSSPLAIPELSTDSLMAASCDGVVTMVTGLWLMPNEYGGDEAVDISVMLVGDLPMRVEWQAAGDRTEFGKMDGYPALIEQPIRGQIMNAARQAYVLLAEPKDDAPAIVVRVTAGSLEGAAHVVISSLEKRIAKMGLPPNPYN